MVLWDIRIERNPFFLIVDNGLVNPQLRILEGGGFLETTTG